MSKSKFVVISIWFFAVSKAVENSENIKQVEKLKEYNNESKSFYHYAPEFSTSLNARNSPPKPRILLEIPEETTRNKHEILSELGSSLAALQFQPVALLMDSTCQAFLNTEYFTNNLLDKPNIRNEFWLMKFNASGVTNIVAQSRQSSEEIKKYIKNEIGQTLKNINGDKGSATFFAILKASQILPKTSAILLFTERRPIDEDLSQLALTNLIQKKIRLYVIWNDVLSTQGHERLLRETTIHSHGFFYSGNQINSTLDCRRTDDAISKHMISTKGDILLKKTIQNNEKLLLPVDYSVKIIDVLIEGNIHNAALTLPSGYTVYLQDLMSEKRQFPGGINAHAHKNWTHIQFDTSKVAKHPTFGIWELKISGPPNYSNGFNVTIYAESVLSVSTKLVKSTGQLYSTNSNPKNDIELNIAGRISKIEKISIIDKNGKEIQDIHYNPMQNLKIQDEKNTNNFTLHITNVTVPKDSFYLQVTGSTEQGETFSRLSYVENKLQTRNLPMLIIESSVRSNLIATAGSNPKVIFEVTNNYDRAIFVPFSVQDEKSMLRDLVPKGAAIPPKGSIEVTVYTVVPPSSTLQYTNLITLTAYGQVRAQKSAMLYVNTDSRTRDTTLPYLNYKFTSTCMEVPYSSCHSGIWAIEVTAQDAESGLLRVVSEPAGLYSPNNYVSGTKETVTLYYTNNCCQPYLDITAIDLNNNKYTYKVDAYHATLSTGSIVAITLGILLLIIIIIVAVILIRKCLKKRDSLDLPRYRGQTGTSRF